MVWGFRKDLLVVIHFLQIETPITWQQLDALWPSLCEVVRSMCDIDDVILPWYLNSCLFLHVENECRIDNWKTDQIEQFLVEKVKRSSTTSWCYVGAISLVSRGFACMCFLDTCGSLFIAVCAMDLTWVFHLERHHSIIYSMSFASWLMMVRVLLCAISGSLYAVQSSISIHAVHSHGFEVQTSHPQVLFM